MKLLKQSSQILFCDPYLLNLIELAGRTCYKSESKISSDSHKIFIKNILSRKHESVIEHSLLSVKFITDRGISHEIVRHRLCSFSQESSRYVNYSKQGCQFIIPFWYTNICDNIDEVNQYLTQNWNIDEISIACNLDDTEKMFLKYLSNGEKMYNQLISAGQKPEQARAVLPTCTKTEIVVSANFREWRHIFRLRMSSKAHPQIQELMLDLYNKLRVEYPEIFEIMFIDIL